MTTVMIELPADVVADLTRVAPLRGFSDWEALLRAYIGQGLRQDLARLDSNQIMSNLLESLRAHGVSNETIASAVAEAQYSTY